MEEGQLKKRIVAQSNNGLSPEEKDGDINSEDLLQWLDEAKKEFPVFGHIETEFLKKRQIMPVDDIKQEFVHAVYNWFEKWFGTEEKKHE